MPANTTLLYVLEIALAYILLRIFLSADHSSWLAMRDQIEEMPHFGEALGQAQSAFVSPWSVEYLPNPIMFSTAVAMYAGYNAARAALRTCKESNGAGKKTERAAETLGGNGNEEVTCAACGSGFRTEGLLRRHTYRKHIRRFTCKLCDSSFHLKKDLERHEQTVHRRLRDAGSGYTCTNPHCSAPDTVFARKDNFNRHVKRCAMRQHRQDVQVVTKNCKIAPAGEPGI
ncbi:hypothetical protein DE146DRAFT_388025 [Phaeosphaeria sp. MPI-PUGE-AT-0046c]|nr:hypothetical protein DE146DRAFT_388025 [Phaeosphaeria sp. MPI-PUGE-AT-0046c]